MTGDQKLPHIRGANSVYQDGRGFFTAVFNYVKSDGTDGRKPIRAKTAADLKRKSAIYLDLLETTGRLPGTSPRLDHWIAYWLENVEVRPKTLTNYRSMSKHIIRHAGTVRLDSVTTTFIKQINKKVTAATSSTTALTVYRILSSALSAAVDEGKIAKNPAKRVKPPRKNKVTLDVLSIEEAGRLIQMFGDSDERILWATFLLTGARRGEILGLEWDRVSDALDLSWQLQRHATMSTAPVDYEYRVLGNGLYLTRPKSEESVRVVPLVEPLAGILRRWRAAAPRNPHGLVFAMPDGSPIDPDYASHKWPKVLRAAGIHRKTRLHDLRHTAIDLMAEAGVPMDDIRAIVGHSTVAMTRAYKSKATRERLRLALEPFTRMLSQPEVVPSGDAGSGKE
jgi:integrase